MTKMSLFDGVTDVFIAVIATLSLKLLDLRLTALYSDSMSGCPTTVQPLARESYADGQTY